jgi:hypothetical protein
MTITHIFLISAMALIGGCTEERSDTTHPSATFNEHVVSGPSWCLEMTPEHEHHLKSRTDLKAYRELREFYADCDPSRQHSNDLLIAAQGAARLGNESDQQDFQLWKKAYGHVEDAGNAP